MKNNGHNSNIIALHRKHPPLLIGILLLTPFYSNAQTGNNAPSENVISADPVSWITESRTYHETFKNQPFVANGYMGMRLPSAGAGYWVGSQPPDDKSAFATGASLQGPRYTSVIVAGYRGKGETNYHYVSALPNWSPLTVGDSQSTFDPMTLTSEQLSDYSQKTDMKNGLVTTSLIWKTASGNSAKLKWTTFTHQQNYHLGVVRLDITPLHWKGPMNVAAFIDGKAIRRGKQSYTVQNVKADTAEMSMRTETLNELATVSFKIDKPKIAKIAMAINQDQRSGIRYQFNPEEHRTYTFIKYVGVATSTDFDKKVKTAASDNHIALASQVADNAFNGAERKPGIKGNAYDLLLASHIRAWDKLWQSDVIVDKDHQVLQKVIHTAEYEMYSSTREGQKNSLSPGGLASDNYGGMVFWDAEIWMYPWLLTAHPEMAKPVLDFRSDRLALAYKNVIDNRQKLQATEGAYFPSVSATGLLAEDSKASGDGGWHEIHLPGDIALSAIQYYYTTGDKQWLKTTGFPLIKGVANFYASRAIYGQPSGKWTLGAVTGPDQDAIGVYEDAYTNSAAITALGSAITVARQLGEPVPPGWIAAQQGLIRPIVDTTNNIHLEYKGYEINHEIKQADVTMMSFPLEFAMDENIAKNDVVYYDKVTRVNGPAMTSAIEAVAAAKYGMPEFARFFSDSYTPFVSEPFYNFSEINNSVEDSIPAFPFMTGSGGFMQTFPFGFAGYRFREDSVFLSPFMPTQAIDGAPLSLVYIKGLNWQNRVLNIAIRPEKTSVSLVHGKPLTVSTACASLKLKPDEPLILNTRSN